MGAGYSIRARGNASAEIYIYEDVGEDWFGGVSAKRFAEDLKALGKVDQIDLRLNSYGGSVSDGLAIYRQLVEHPAKVITHVDGMACSIAALIAMAGQEIHIAEAGFIMIHNASGGCVGEARDMRQMADLLDTVTAATADVFVARTGKTLQRILDWMDAETWFGAADAVTEGFATDIAENMRIAAHARPAAKHQFLHVPAQIAARALAEAAAIPPLAAVAVGRPNLQAASELLARMRARITLAA